MMRRGIGRVGRPGLVGTMARTAVVAGTASAVAGSVGHRQQQKYAAQDQQQAEAAAYEQQVAAAQQVAAQQAAQAAPPASGASSMDDTIAQLQKLGDLKSQGILSEAEFEAAKAKLLT